MINIREKLTHLMRSLTRKREDGQTDQEMSIQSTVEAATATARRRPQTDIPMDVLDNAYTPNQTSVKAGFRTSGEDHQRDQEFASGVADDRWNDEDRFTNKSGDPRIGTHGRTYEPGESRADSSKGGH